ncbi:MAG: hypothetical protein FD129_3348 [bacterium]|nr:MAG: hypothetical protein FD129_3348 [bacterium]
MSDEARLTGQYHPVSERRGAGDSNLRDDQAVLARAHVMRQHDQIVDLGSGPNDGRSHRGTVDRHIGADLGDLAVFSGLAVGGETVAVAADHGSRLDDDAVADHAVLADDDPGMDEAASPENDVFSDEALGRNLASFSD